MLAATRRLIGRHGIEGATFDLITQEAGVGRGTIHWAYGSKERLLLELLKADAAARFDALRAAVAPATSAEEVGDALAAQVTGFLEDELGVHVLLQELGSVALREPEIGKALATRRVEWSELFAQLLEAKAAEGVIELPGEPAMLATLLTAFGHGLATNALLDPDCEVEPMIESARECVLRVLEPANDSNAG